MARSSVGCLSFMKGISLVTDLEASVKHKEGAQAHLPRPPQTATVPTGQREAQGKLTRCIDSWKLTSGDSWKSYLDWWSSLDY